MHQLLALSSSFHCNVAWLAMQGIAINTGDQLEIAQQIATGMEYVASKRLVHVDLACRNCLVDERGDIQVADFGLARYLGRGDEHVILDKSGEFPIRWMAPECTSSDGRMHVSLKTDVWVSCV